MPKKKGGGGGGGSGSSSHRGYEFDLKTPEPRISLKEEEDRTRRRRRQRTLFKAKVAEIMFEKEKEQKSEFKIPASPRNVIHKFNSIELISFFFRVLSSETRLQKALSRESVIYTREFVGKKIEKRFSIFWVPG